MTTTVRNGNAESCHLAAGDALYVTCDARSTGNVLRMRTPVDSYGLAAAAPAGVVTQVGPYLVATLLQVQCVTGVLTFMAGPPPTVADDAAASAGDSLSAGEVAATQALVSAAWTSANSGAWLPAKFSAITRLMANGGASGGTYTVSYRNQAQVVTIDDAEATAAGAADVSPLYLDDALELSIAVTGTVTVEMH